MIRSSLEFVTILHSGEATMSKDKNKKGTDKNQPAKTTKEKQKAKKEKQEKKKGS